MRRVTYEEMAAAWPASTDDYAAPMNDIPKVVFSKTLSEATWPESSIARGGLAEEITALKNQPGGEIIAWGGAGFAQALSRAGLIDRYAIVVQPVVFGGGKPIFRDLRDALHLRLLATTTFPVGDNAPPLGELEPAVPRLATERRLAIESGADPAAAIRPPYRPRRPEHEGDTRRRDRKTDRLLLNAQDPGPALAPASSPGSASDTAISLLRRLGSAKRAR